MIGDFFYLQLVGVQTSTACKCLTKQDEFNSRVRIKSYSARTKVIYVLCYAPQGVSEHPRASALQKIQPCQRNGLAKGLSPILGLSTLIYWNDNLVKILFSWMK
jgi:hypothetical protein